MPKKIRIENPVAGHGWTSRQKAKKYVSRGLAYITPHGTLRFLRNGDHQSASVQRVVDRTAAAYDRAACGQGIPAEGELASLPVTAPARLLNRGRRKGASGHVFRMAAGY
jgi:hypothetical protein